MGRNGSVGGTTEVVIAVIAAFIVGGLMGSIFGVGIGIITFIFAYLIGYGKLIQDKKKDIVLTNQYQNVMNQEKSSSSIKSFECSKCHQTYKKNDKFCSGCGTKVN